MSCSMVRRSRGRPFAVAHAEVSNALWCIDFKGPGRCYPPRAIRSNTGMPFTSVRARRPELCLVAKARNSTSAIHPKPQPEWSDKRGGLLTEKSPYVTKVA